MIGCGVFIGPYSRPFASIRGHFTCPALSNLIQYESSDSGRSCSASSASIRFLRSIIYSGNALAVPVLALLERDRTSVTLSAVPSLRCQIVLSMIECAYAVPSIIGVISSTKNSVLLVDMSGKRTFTASEPRTYHKPESKPESKPATYAPPSAVGVILVKCVSEKEAGAF